MSELFNRIPAEQLIIKELASSAASAPIESSSNSEFLIKVGISLIGTVLLGIVVSKIIKSIEDDKKLKSFL